MINYYVTCLKKFADFEGRARRKEYWYFMLFNIIVSIVLGATDAAVGTFDEETGRGLLGTIYSIAVLIPGIAVGIRRMHDVGKSGWFILIPFYNIILACTDSEAGTNQYGPNPKTSEYDISEHLVP